MTDNFPAFAKLVAASFQELAKDPNPLIADIDGDVLYAHYLAAFPEGTNPIFKKNTEHDCSCCRQFIRRAGGVITIKNGQTRTIWGKAAEKAPEPYKTVATFLSNAVVMAGPRDLFRVAEAEASFGTERSRSLDKETQVALSWNHLYTGEIPRNLRVKFPDTVRGDYRTTVQVFERGLIELKPEALDTVIDLIEDNNLYRGVEYKENLILFRKLQQEYLKKTGHYRTTFVWENAGTSAARFRNTVMGTLLQDLSEGKDLEFALNAYEKKVAPENFKRPKALITPAMVKQAMDKVAELGLESALERRFAVIGDISINDVKWVDGAVKSMMKGGLSDVLMREATKNVTNKSADQERAEDISLEEFVSRALPQTTSLELLFKGEHVTHLMSLTAPIHPEPKQLFRWTNDFAWSYRGGAADSFLRQQVQSLGGRVDGVLRFSHMWNHEGRNASLMDLHVFMPGTSSHSDGCHDVYPSGHRVGWNRCSDGISGGVQDVDYTQAAPEGYVPVENITFPTIGRLKDGPYTFKIHNWQLRPPTTSGFRAEIEFGGQVYQYDHPQPLKHKEWITLAVATLKNGVFTIEHKHPVGNATQEVWGLTTEQYVKVKAVTLSPNYWGDNAVGNKHTFFVLEGAKNDESARGFYNEFLHPRLEVHRKVFEVIGDKTKCQPTDGQLSGLGFSSTKKASFIVRAQQGKRQRIYNVQVGTAEATSQEVTNLNALM